MATVAGELVVLPLAPAAVAVLAQVHVADVQLHFVKSRDGKKAYRYMYLPAASKY